MNPFMSTQFYKAIVDHGLDIVTIVDSTGLIRFDSPAVSHVLGYSQEARVGQSLFSLLHPEDRPAAYAAFKQGLASTERQPPFECRCRHRDGRWIDVEAVGTYLHDFPGGPVGLVHTRDLTDRRTLEAQLRHAQKLEPVAQIAASIIHDFNNLITAMAGSAQMLSEIPLPAQAYRHIAQMQSATERAVGLTRQLLTFSYRHAKLDAQPLKVNDSLGTLAGILERVGGKQAQLTCRLDAEDDVVMIGPGLLDQVIVNLVINARDAMPDGGLITLSTRNVTQSPTGRGPATRCLAIQVKDTGTGITDAIKAHIFEPFFTTKPADKGTGLGLPTVCRIVEQAGGRVDVDSVVGQGTTFRIVLPLRQQAAWSLVRGA
jgi:two-component system, cell cycle sensor histidine kinase and response regulator CckA